MLLKAAGLEIFLILPASPVAADASSLAWASEVKMNRNYKCITTFLLYVKTKMENYHDHKLQHHCRTSLHRLLLLLPLLLPHDLLRGHDELFQRRRTEDLGHALGMVKQFMRKFSRKRDASH